MTIPLKISTDLLLEILKEEFSNKKISLIDPYQEKYTNLISTDVHYAKVSGQEMYTTRKINIYELAQRYEDWVYSKGFMIITYPLGFNEYDAFVVKKGGQNIHKEPIRNFYHLPSRPIAIFKAAEWIYEELCQH